MALKMLSYNCVTVVCTALSSSVKTMSAPHIDPVATIRLCRCNKKAARQYGN